MVPTRMLTSRHIGSGTPFRVSIYPEISAEQNITGPIEKSIPPVAITNVTPSARNPKK